MANERYIVRTTHDPEGERTSYYDKRTGLITETFTPRAYPGFAITLDQALLAAGINIEEFVIDDPISGGLE